MLKKAINDNVFKFEEVIIETLSCFKRAGADAIITRENATGRIAGNGLYTDFFRKNFPGKVLYAVKTNPNERVLKLSLIHI